MLTRLRAWWFLAALVVALAVATAACDNGDEKDEQDVTPDASPTEAGTPQVTGELLTSEDVLKRDPDVIKQAEVEWGFMFELSGGIMAGFGEPTGDGVLMAVQEINEAGGFQVGDTIYTIKLIKHDTRSDVAQTVAVTRELVLDEEVNVIWGPATVGEPQSTPLTQQARVLHLCPCQEREATALSSIEQAQDTGPEGSHWAFQTLLPFGLLIAMGARDFVVDYPDFDTFALLCQNTQTGRDICERTKEAYQEVGVELVGEEYFPPETTDYSPFLTQLARCATQCYLFNFHDPLGQASIVRQALELGVGGLQIASLPADLIEDLVGIPLTVPVTAGAAPRQHVQPTSEEVGDYFERYKAFKGGELPFAAFVSLLTYDYVYMLAAAMQQAGTVEDTTAIADALEQIRYDGVAEDEMFFNSRHLGVHGTDPCTIFMGEITCKHLPAPPEAFE